MSLKMLNTLRISTLGKLTAISFILVLYPVAADALPTPISSSLRLEADSELGTGRNRFIRSIDSDSQDSTINPLTASVSALVTSPLANILSTAEGLATWSDSSRGQVNLFNIGWNTVGVNFGSAQLNRGLDWTYEFLADTTGLFTLDYEIIGYGSDTGGLIGFNFYWPGYFYSPGPEGFEFLGVNTSGTLTRAITAGNTYTVGIKNFANIGGGLGTRNAHMDGTFNWKIDTDAVAVPEPSSTLVTLAFGTLGAGSVLKRKRNKFVR